MKIVWNDQTVRWFQHASEFTGYHRKLSEMILEQIPNGGTLCDVGCGAGLIDFELSPYFKEITCVDISQEAVNAVKKEAKSRDISNISSLCIDGQELEEQWDVVMALFHGGPRVLERYFHLAKDVFVLATHGTLVGNFGPQSHKVRKCFDVAGTKEILDAKGIKYKLLELSLEYGQPLCDLQEAEAFVETYTMPMEKSEMDAYLKEHLQHTEDNRFPYYLPNEKRIGLFIIRRDENENF